MVDFVRGNVGDIILIKEGKNNKKIAYTDEGKVIIITNPIKVGFAEITNVVSDKEKCIIVKAKNIIKDYHDDMSYNEFIEMLKIKGYKVGFERPFEYEGKQEKQILAYNLQYGTILLTSTWDNQTEFGDVYVYAPVNGLNQFRCNSITQASSTQTRFCISHSSYTFPLKHVHSMVDNNEWDEKDDICLWTYADDYGFRNNYEWGFQASELWAKTIDRILLADSEIEQILGNSKRLKPIFASRNNE